MSIHSFGPIRPDPFRDIAKSFMPRPPSIWDHLQFGRNLDLFRTNAEILLQEIEESGEFSIEAINSKYGQLVNPLVYMVSALYAFIDHNAHTETMNYEYMGGLTPLPQEVVDYLREQTMNEVSKYPKGDIDPYRDLNIPIWHQPKIEPDLRFNASYILDKLLRVKEVGE